MDIVNLRQPRPKKVAKQFADAHDRHVVVQLELWDYHQVVPRRLKPQRVYARPLLDGRGRRQVV